MLKKNLFYSLIYELIIAVYPIILIPYLSNTIGKSGVGIYSYTYSIVGFFLLVSQLGVNTCGTRAIAKTKDNKELMTKTFKSIFFIQAGMGILSLFIFITFIFLFDTKYKLYFYLLIPFIIGQTIRISWFFLGLEQIRTILLRNIWIRILSAALIFLFVKDEKALPLYFLIMSLSYLGGDISVWPVAIGKMSKTPWDWHVVKSYVRPMVIMFLPLLALRGAYYIDEIMLGFIGDTDSVGIYENAYKVVNMPLQLYTVFANVLTARASHLVANNKTDENITYIVNSIDFSSAIIIPIIGGLISFSSELVPWYMGVDFLPSIQVMHILPLVLIFSGINSILRTQYFIPMNQDYKYVYTIFCGVFINISLNFLLITRFTYLGVALATVLSESIITIISVYLVTKEASILQSFRNFPLYVFASIVMALIIRLIGNYLGFGLFTNIIQITISIPVYFIQVLVFQKLFAKSESLTLYKICEDMWNWKKSKR